METPFDISQWKPTKPPEPPDSPREEDDIPSLAKQLSTQTSIIKHHPYDPTGWLRRADTLARMQYPELAVGDAYKAYVLIHDFKYHLAQQPGYKLGHRMGFWMKDEGRLSAYDPEAHQIRLTKLQSQARRLQTDNMYYWPEHDEVRIIPQPYPWLRPQHRTRSDELIAALNQEFATNPVKTETGERYCILKRHAFGERASSSEVLGVFATRNIKKDQMILTDSTRTFGCNGPGPDGSRSNLNGGMGCSDRLHPNLPSDPPNSDLRWIRERAGKNAADAILRCRLLIECVQSHVAHPLDHPLIARLTPTYHRPKPRVFSLETDIATPNLALQRFGIDIFASHAYDTWVLFTIQARIENNSWSNPTSTCLNPLFSLFNHSCEPNVRWSTGGDCRTILMKAWRDVAVGEQLVVEYDGFVAEQPVGVRKKRLERWIEGGCWCERCEREELEGRLRVQADGGGMLKEAKGWDVEVKPVLPEDRLVNTLRSIRV